nr:MAG TPA: hypothetical protein [Caudoviricetes sp.]
MPVIARYITSIIERADLASSRLHALTSNHSALAIMRFVASL